MAGLRRRRGKSGAVKTVIDGITFDSKLEAVFYNELKMRQLAGEISDLELQPRFDFEINGVKIGRYTGDFRYTENGKSVVADAKGGWVSRDYPLRKKLLKALYNIDILELRATPVRPKVPRKRAVKTL
ncbi:MAG: DUF1064 domain-containing protein [Pyrinomonadaceae bacterium MAG19_C2-C3]|nr:DUF1064 domain-containing protein [Pyrinomonadaceae bacterium MAG19_C2-C3]